MLNSAIQQLILNYLADLPRGRHIRRLRDLEAMDSRSLLELSQQVEDQFLGLFVQLLKSSKSKSALFQKLMGSHEEENRRLVDSFFSRYMKHVIQEEKGFSYFNPLIIYLPKETFGDLAFVQSRQKFFLRQRIETINEYLMDVFGEDPAFKPGEQEKSWFWFWNKLLVTQ
jgi:hypothetical protein